MTQPQRPQRLLLVNADGLQLPSPAQAPLELALVEAGFVVVACAGFTDAQQRLQQEMGWDLIVITGGPSDPDLLAFCSLSDRRGQPSPVLVLGSAAGEAARVRALEAGADDVLLQPFGLAECLARCRALIRRHHLASMAAKVLSCGPIEMVVEEHLVRRSGTSVTLSPREFRLLQFLLEHQGRIWHREELLRRVWGEWEALDLDPKTVDVHIHWLRLKLEDNPTRPSLITTVRGRGYRLG
ncbi:MAG: response regulator transcription factor [Cyanobacteriota bacterium]|nr:response regulator transcription factor [Cyanobacteriota bacterium]